MQLLVSPKSLDEALECIKGQVDIIDVKNPAEGSLGANFPWIIRSIRKAVPIYIPISATIGDISFKPGTVALAALGAAYSGASFVKVGLFDVATVSEAITIMTAVKQTIEEYQLPVSVVAAGYAEGEEIGSINPLKIPEVAIKASCDFAMIDTFNKQNRRALFDILNITKLEEFIAKCRENDIGTALGGSITKQHIPIVKKLNPDIIGIRRAVCEKGDRLEGKIKAKLIVDFAEELKKEN